MPLQREYYPSDTLKLVNRSESLLVRGGVRGTAKDLGVDDKYAAHSIGRHLLRGGAGSLGHGIGFDEFRDRFLESPENVSSAWAGKGEMAILLCELLNSDIGQHALKQMDRGVGRVMVHYLNLGKLKGLFRGLAGQAKFQESRVFVTPASEIVTMVPVINTKTNQPVMVKGVAKMIARTTMIPRKAEGKVKAADIASVNAVLDRFGGQLHLQTFYPSSDPVESYAEWRIGAVTIRAAFDAKGKLLSRMLAGD